MTWFLIWLFFFIRLLTLHKQNSLHQNGETQPGQIKKKHLRKSSKIIYLFRRHIAFLYNKNLMLSFQDDPYALLFVYGFLHNNIIYGDQINKEVHHHQFYMFW